MKTIIVFMQNKPFLGAQIVQIPFFYFIRKDNPDAKIIGIAPENSSYLISTFGMLDEEYIYPRKGKWWEIFRLAAKISIRGEGMVFQHRKHSVRTTFAAKIAAGNNPVIGFQGDITRWFYTRQIPFDFGSYMADVYLKLIGYSLEQFHREIAPVGYEKEPLITIIPGGSKSFKKYPLEKYLEIAAYFEGKYRIRFILGPDMLEEKTMLEKHSSRFDLVFQPPFRQLEKMIRQSSLIIANDCGPSHFGHVYNIPRITLFASDADVRQWFYFSPNSRAFWSSRRDNIETIPISKIISAAEELLH